MTGPTDSKRVTREDVIDGLSRAYDLVKPEPGMDGPHGGHIGGVSRQRAALAIEQALEYLAIRAEGLDVERLARAMPNVMSQETCDAVMGPGHDPLDLPEEWYESPREMAALIAAEYARLGGERPPPDPEPFGILTEDERPTRRNYGLDNDR